MGDLTAGRGGVGGIICSGLDDGEPNFEKKQFRYDFDVVINFSIRF